MKILYIAPCLPNPPDKGERIRAFHQVDYLARRHEVHLACLIDEEPETQDTAPLEQLCASVLIVSRGRHLSRLRGVLAFSMSEPFSIAAFRSRRFAEAIGQKLNSEKFDCIFVLSSAMAQYVHHVSGTPKVIDFIDVDSELWRQAADRRRFPSSYLHRLEAQRLARHEKAMSRAFELSIFVSANEAEVFRRHVPGGRVSVVTNGVDLEYYAPDSAELAPGGPPLALFTGTMDYEPNVDAVRHFCRNILPLTRGPLPELEFCVVGRRPKRSVRRLARNSRVTVTGPVNDVRPYLRRAGVVVAPLRLGTGLQNKVLEAMASGVPVVGTSHAFRGLKSPEAAGVRVADHQLDFAKEVIALLTDTSLHHECARTARQYVETHHRWNDRNAELEQLLREVTEGRSLSGLVTSKETAF